MKLASVRALKTELLSESLNEFGFTRKIARRYLAEIGYAKNARPTPSLALGIAPGRTTGAEYSLAVRLFDRSTETQRLALRAFQASKGEADVRYVGRVRAPRPSLAGTGFRTPVRPIAPGYSVAHHRVAAGTIGGFVTRSDGYVYLLSNNHVLADTNRSKKGDDVLQPGPLDGGRRVHHLVGWFSRTRRIVEKGNEIDAALALLSDKIDYELEYAGTQLVGVQEAVDIGDEVWKVGRTSGITRGQVSAFDVDNVEVDYSDAGDGSMLCSFEGQIEIKGRKGRQFSYGGDSGSLIINRGNEAVGLLFAGADETDITYANPIQIVLDAFNAELLLG